MDVGSIFLRELHWVFASVDQTHFSRSGNSSEIIFFLLKTNKMNFLQKRKEKNIKF